MVFLMNREIISLIQSVLPPNPRLLDPELGEDDNFSFTCNPMGAFPFVVTFG